MTTINEALWDDLGRMADSLDNALAANLLAIPDRIKIEGMEGIIRDVSTKLKEIVVERSGLDPWEFHR